MPSASSTSSPLTPATGLALGTITFAVRPPFSYFTISPVAGLPTKIDPSPAAAIEYGKKDAPGSWSSDTLAFGSVEVPGSPGGPAGPSLPGSPGVPGVPGVPAGPAGPAGPLISQAAA